MAAIAQARQDRPDTDQPTADETTTTETPSSPPPPAASPPTEGRITPTVKADTQLVPPEGDEEETKLKSTVDKLFPELRPAQRNPWAQAAMMLPSLMGQPATSLAMMEGYQSGQAAREMQARTIQEQRARLLMPYYEQTAASRSTARIQTARLELENNKAAFTQDLASTQQAFKEFEWANPSATAKLRLEYEKIALQARVEHQLATEAIAGGRLDVYAQHNDAWIGLMGQLRDNQRQMVDIAQQRLDEGTPANTISLYKFAAGKVADLQAQMAWVTPAQAKGLQSDLAYYRNLSTQLRPKVERLGGLTDEGPSGGTGLGTGAVPTQVQPGRGFSAGGTGTERTYQTRLNGVLTATQVGNAIARAKAGGESPARIRQRLQDEGINPADFGY
jgi:hypothetical protein